MAGRLAGKIAVITGAGSGIGLATAEHFAAQGATVLCADISGRQDETARTIGKAAVAIHCDVSKSEDVAAMVATAEDRFGRLDILVNNAGYSSDNRPLHEHDDALFDKLVAVNLKGVFNGMRYGVVSMLKNGGGSIINIASAAGLVGWKGISIYSATKGGVVQMTKSGALDYADRKIRVNAICPGIVWTGMASQTSLRAPPPGRETLETVPMRRWGLDREIAAAAIFLASDEASFVTGIAMPVDGGYTTGRPDTGLTQSPL
jgi:NAD(P)-dependent dehydrogenase (short-subunit alcohol dehydrogenase family)